MWANSEIHKRIMVPIKTRKLCHCGCRKRATHAGTANGISLTYGCEMSVRVWVRDGAATFARRKNTTQSKGGSK